MDNKSALGRGKAVGRPDPGVKSNSVEVGSVLVFAVAIFILVALCTYSPSDPSFFTTTAGGARSEPPLVFNACGRVGAYVAAICFQCFGIAAFLVPPAFFFISASIFKREGGLRLVGTLSGMIVSVLAMTVFLTLQWKYWRYSGTLMLTGGAFGVWFAQILVQQFNTLGASLVSLSVFCICLALSTPVSIAHLGNRALGALKVFLNRVVLRIVKFALTYAGFLLGLLAMKTAQATARGLESAVEALLRAARDRREAWESRKLMETERRAAVLAAGIPLGSPAGEKAKLPNLIAESAPESAVAGVGDEPVSDVGEAEATNILTEASTTSATPVSAAAGGTMPAILPHEQQKMAEFSPLGSPEKTTAKKAKAPSRRGGWKLPSTDFLVRPPKVESQVDKDRLYQNAEILRQKFMDFEIEGEVTAVRPGPVITLYEFKPAAGVKVSRIASLADDISMALSAQSVRIIAPLPGKSVVGIEIPSETRENVYMREFLQHPDFHHGQKHLIPVAMGKDIAGNTYLSDLAKMPHVLCAGQTGSGKSVFMNGLITSLLFRFTPDELRLILVDPKMIEFNSYQDIPHLLLPVVDDSSQAASALKWAVREMERRYRILAMTNARNLASFNQRVEEIGADMLQETLADAESQIEGLEKMSGGDWLEAFEKDEDGEARYGKLPYIVIIIDELADLMMTAKKEVEISIARIAQKARAAGIHLVVATQRPSTDVVTGIIKANLPSRVSFQLASGIDSKTILDRVGAERLLGRGDMFFIPPGTSNLLRLHGAYLSDDEINKVTGFLRAQGKPNYRNEILVDEDAENEELDGDGDDPMFPQAVEFVKNKGTASASALQRQFRLGYNRAARLIEVMEHRGIVGPADGARPRDVLMR